MQQGYYNATRAAQEIGISYKTMLRRIEEGKIIAAKGEDGQFIIPESEVEKQKQKRVNFVHSLPVTPTPTSHDQSALIKRIATLENRVSELEQTIRDMTSHDQRPVVTASEEKPRPVVTIPDQLPPGTLTSTQFRMQLHIDKPAMDTYIQRGISGERLPMTRIAHPTRKGYMLTYFTPDQQEQARALLRKHGKI